MELCQHDYSQFNDSDVNEHGLFDYPYLDHYWTEPRRFPFLVRVEKTIAGFVLVRALETDGHRPAWEVAELFILRKYRRRGIGHQTVHHLLQQFEGDWRITYENGNLPARAFWQSIETATIQSRRRFSVRVRT
jgi:predicted acetyltransferase